MTFVFTWASREELTYKPDTKFVELVTAYLQKDVCLFVAPASVLGKERHYH